MKQFILKPLFSFIVLVLVSGCGQEKTAEIQMPAASNSENIPAASAPAAFVPSEGVISGKVIFNGTPPAPAALDMAADPYCSSAHTEPVYAQDLVVNPNGTVRYAFVYVTSGIPEGAVFPVPSEPVVVDQKGCQYTPHVLGVRTGQTVTLVNSDSTLHNVHAQVKNSQEFNLGMPLQGMKITKKFPKAEIMAHLKCDVHPWMSAYIGVLDHPFFAVTGEDGSFEIKGLPAGNYQVQIWHEKLGAQNIPVEVPAKGAAEITANYNA